MISAQYFKLFEALRGAADIVDETNPNEIYLGYFQPGIANEASATASICQITKTGAITRIRWANGTFAFNLIWNNRATYTYFYKSF